jgi:Ca-activated chloride channel homolog
MLRFEYPEKIWWLGLVPIVWLFLRWAWRKRVAALALFGNINLLNINLFSNQHQQIRVITLCSAVALLMLAWANPQKSGAKETIRQQSADVFIALDVSNSMLAEDTRPNRLEKAKHFASRLTGALAGNRIGIIVFAGNAFLQMPLTNDYATAQIFIQSADPSLVPTQGTAIAEAIDITSKNVLSQKERHPAALIVISDGEDHDKNAENAAKNAIKNGISVSTVGVGSPEGGAIPNTDRGGYKQDEAGNTIKSALNEPALQAIAAAGNGSYVGIEDENQAIAAMSKVTEQLEKRDTELRSFNNYQSFFQFPLFFALSLLSIDYFVLNYFFKTKQC